VTRSSVAAGAHGSGSGSGVGSISTPPTGGHGYVPPSPLMTPLVVPTSPVPVSTHTVHVRPPKPLILPSSPMIGSLPSSPSSTQLYPRSPSGRGMHGFGFGGTGSDMPRSFSTSMKDGMASPFISSAHSVTGGSGAASSSKSRYCTDGYIAFWLIIGILPFAVFTAIEEIYDIEASPTFLGCSTQVGVANTPALAGSIVFHTVEALVLLVSVMLVW
jgi:hypothetical protein